MMQLQLSDSVCLNCGGLWRQISCPPTFHGPRSLFSMLTQVASVSRRIYREGKEPDYSETRVGGRRLFGKIHCLLLWAKNGGASESESFINASGSLTLLKCITSIKTEKPEKFRFKELDFKRIKYQVFSFQLFCPCEEGRQDWPSPGESWLSFRFFCVLGICPVLKLEIQRQDGMMFQAHESSCFSFPWVYTMMEGGYTQP